MAAEVGNNVQNTMESNDDSDVLRLEPSTDLIDAAPPEEFSDEEIITKSNKKFNFENLSETSSAGRLRSRVPDIPENLLELIYTQKCNECNSSLTTISSALSHYNSTKHQNKLMYLFLPRGSYNLPLSKEEIREIETGIVKSGEPNSIASHKAKNQPWREMVKKFDINEDVKKLDLTFCRLCEMPFSSRVAALQHYSGKKHKKNAENWSPYVTPKPIDTKDDLRCDACNIVVGSSTNMESHVTGKRHQMKMKAYLDRMNAGAIAPPMSSRGFCDFNNVEREEANPVDPSRFTQENFIPSNPTSSFLRSYEDGTGAGGGYDGTMPVGSEFGATFDESSYYGGAGAADYDYSNAGADYGGTAGYGAEYSFTGDGQFPPPPWTPGQGGYGQLPSSYATPLRSTLNAPYAAPNFNRIQNRYPVGNQNFGPTKFKYNKK